MSVNTFPCLDRLIKSTVVAFSVLVLLLIIFKWLHYSFAIFANISLISFFIIFLIAFIFLKESKIAEVDEDVPFLSPKGLVFLTLLSMLFGLFVSSIHAPEEDDTFYASPVVSSIEQPQIALNDTMGWLVPWDDGKEIKGLGLAISHGYEYFLGAVAYQTDISFLVLYQAVGTFFWASFFFIVCAYLLLRFLNERSALWGTVAIGFLSLFVFREGGVGLGIYLHKIWIGKTILQIVLMPLLACFIYDFLKSPHRLSWLVVFCSTIFASGFSLSAIFLVSALIAALVISNGLHGILCKEKCKLAPVFFLALSNIYILIIGLYIYSEAKSMMNKEDAALAGGQMQDYFYSAYHSMLGSFDSVSTLLVVLSLVVLFILNREKNTFIIYWFFASIIIFVNPITDVFVAEYLTSSVTYGRILTVVPWFIVVGLAIGRLHARYLDGRSWGGLINFLAGGLAIAGTLLYVSYSDDFRKELDVPKRDVIGKPFFSEPLLTHLDAEYFRDTQEIMKVLSPGNTLSSEDYTIIIPMVTSRFPQYYFWPPEQMPLTGKSNDSIYNTEGVYENQGRKRYRSAAFLRGVKAFEKDFIWLIHTDVKNIVVKRSLNDYMGVQLIVENSGFYMVKETSRYVAYTKREED